MNNFQYDMVVIGSGPAGQKAAIQGAKSGQRVAMIESDKVVGGHCVHRGTIPSKTLRQNAIRIAQLREYQQLFSFSIREDIAMDSLMTNMEHVIKSHDSYINAQLSRNAIEYIHGRASFVDTHTLDIVSPGGEGRTVNARNIIIATGSYPREATQVPVDHEHIFDSDSILSLVYLPRSLTVLGGGVNASE